MATTALAKAREIGDTDPLGAYSELLEADGELDIQLDEARGAENNYQRTLGMVDRTISDATHRLRSVEDSIHNRGRMIGVEARSAAQSAGQLIDEALQLRDQRPRDAYNAAQQANALAKQAGDLVRRDVDDYNRRNNYHGRGGGGGAAPRSRYAPRLAAQRQRRIRRRLRRRWRRWLRRRRRRLRLLASPPPPISTLRNYEDRQQARWE